LNKEVNAVSLNTGGTAAWPGLDEVSGMAAQAGKRELEYSYIYRLI